MLLGALVGVGMPLVHMMLARTVVTNEIARARGDYFFVWTLIAIGLTSLFPSSSRLADRGAGNGLSPGSLPANAIGLPDRLFGMAHGTHGEMLLMQGGIG